MSTPVPSSTSSVQPDVAVILDDLATQVAILTRDLAIARATIAAHEKAATLAVAHDQDQESSA